MKGVGGAISQNYGCNLDQGQKITQVELSASQVFHLQDEEVKELDRNVTHLDLDDDEGDVFFDAEEDLNRDEESLVIETGSLENSLISAVSEFFVEENVEDFSKDSYSKAKSALKELVSLFLKDLKYIAIKVRNVFEWVFFPRADKNDPISVFSHNHLPETLTGIVHNVMDYLEMKKVFVQFPLLKIIYEGVSGIIIRGVLKSASDTLDVGIKNLAKELEIHFSKSKEEKEKFLVSVEKNVLEEVRLSLKHLNDAYATIGKSHGFENEVSCELQKRGRLHPAYAVLEKDEEKLWMERDKHLMRDENLNDAIACLSKELNNTNPIEFSKISKIRTELEVLHRLKKIELKIWDVEFKYLKQICEDLFDHVLYPNGTFYKSLPITLKPCAAKLQELFILSLTATLSVAINEVAKPEFFYKQMLSLAGEDSIERDGEYFHNSEDGINGSENAPIVESDNLHPVCQNVCDLGNEVIRGGFPIQTEVLGYAESSANVVHGVASAFFNALSKFTSFFDEAEDSLVAEGFRLAEESFKNYQPSKMKLERIDPYVVEGHQQLMHLYNEQSVNKLLHLTEGLLNQAAIPRKESSETVGVIADEREAYKLQLKSKVFQLLDHQLPKSVKSLLDPSILVSGTEEIIERVSYGRQNKLLVYAALDGLVAAIKEK